MVPTSGLIAYGWRELGGSDNNSRAKRTERAEMAESELQSLDYDGDDGV